MKTNKEPPAEEAARLATRIFIRPGYNPASRLKELKTFTVGSKLTAPPRHATINPTSIHPLPRATVNRKFINLDVGARETSILQPPK
jgi:hypothetical protein